MLFFELNDTEIIQQARSKFPLMSLWIFSMNTVNLIDNYINVVSTPYYLLADEIFHFCLPNQIKTFNLILRTRHKPR